MSQKEEPLNFRLIGVRLAEGLKYQVTLKEVDRIAQAIFDFPFKAHPQENISSARSQRVYDWVMTLSEQRKTVESKVELLNLFIGNLTPSDSPLRNAIDDSRSEPAGLLWRMIHPTVVGVSKSRFERGFFADSVESALKEVNNRVKDYYKTATGKDHDGASLMYKAFAPKRPIIVLDDLKTETGNNIQQGYMQIFAGAMTGVRNPKAHGNLEIKPERAMHFLFLASLLMYKLDEAGVA